MSYLFCPKCEIELDKIKTYANLGVYVMRCENCGDVNYWWSSKEYEFKDGQFLKEKS